MPTYLNNSGKTISMIHSDGESRVVRSGETIATTYFHDADALGVTETAETPYFDSVVANETVNLSSTADTVDIDEDAEFVVVLNITGEVTVKRNVETSLPILEDHTSDDVVLPIAVDGIPGRTKRLSLTGSGSCRVVQFVGYSV